MKDYIKKFNRDEFTAHVKGKFFGYLPANKLVLHHTWKPEAKDWNGEKTMRALKRYYESMGWNGAPHLFVADDGIWLMWDMRKDGIHAGKGNYRSIGIEVVGNYDHKKWSGETKANVLHVLRVLQGKLKIKDSAIMFHRDYSKKTCPGLAITKPWVLSEMKHPTSDVQTPPSEKKYCTTKDYKTKYYDKKKELNSVQRKLNRANATVKEQIDELARKERVIVKQNKTFDSLREILK